MLLDFSKVEDLDSSGLGELVILYTTRANTIAAFASWARRSA